MASVRMGIILDVTRLISRMHAETPTGIDRVELSYAQELSRMESVIFVRQIENRFDVISSATISRLIDYLVERWTCAYTLIQLPVAKPAIPVSDRSDKELPESLVQFIKRQTNVFYINVSHTGMENYSRFEKLVFKWGVRLVFYVHDILPIQFPEYVRPGDDLHHAKRLKNALQYDSIILTNSKTTASDIRSWALAELGIDVESTVLYIGVEEAFHRNPASDIDGAVYDFDGHRELKDNVKRIVQGKRPYFVALGTIEPRKNHILLLQIWRKYESYLDKKAIPLLVITGKRGWENSNVFAILDRCPWLKNSVIEISDLDDYNIMSLMKKSRAILFPSFGEGWGMPLVEAITLGVPVICSDMPVFREASQGKAHFIDPLDAKGWSEAILSFSSPESPARSGQISALHEFTPPKWELHFEALFAVLSRLIAERSVAQFSKGTPGRIQLPREKEFAVPADDPWWLRLKRKPPSQWLRQADEFRDATEYESAAVMYARCLQLDPSNGPVWVQLGHMLKHYGDLQLAYEAYSEAFNLMPNDLDLHIQMGHLFNVAGRQDDANRYYRLANTMQSENEGESFVN